MRVRSLRLLMRYALAMTALALSTCSRADRAGPDDRITNLQVSPASVAVEPGAAVQFEVMGHTASGDSQPVAVTWSATGGIIDPNGRYTAGETAGPFRVIATDLGGILADTASITITPPPPTLAQVLLVPSATTLVSGDSLQFAVYGRMTNGDTVAVDVTYAATGGTISPTGRYMAGHTTGTFQVVATEKAGTLADTASVTIIPPPPVLAQVVLVPPATTLVTGDSLQFAVYGRMTSGDSVSVDVTYAATGGAISATGLYMAGQTPGAYQVIATGPGDTLADTATVTIIPPAPTLARVVLLPDSVTLAPGGVQQFTAGGRMTNGDSVAIAVIYAATGGAITPEGRYTAGGTAGVYQVIATEQGGILADTATVTISAPPTLAQVVLVPSSVTLAPDATRQFAVYGRMSDGDSVTIAVTYNATGGTITAAGRYTAGPTVGEFAVIATEPASGLADTASVTIAAGPPTLTEVVLVPASVTLGPGATQQFTAYGWMTSGDSVTVTVTLSATGGTITAGGLYTAGATAGVYQVIASEQGGILVDTAIVMINAPPTLTQVVLEPPAVTLASGATRQFAAYGRMSDGDSVAITVTYSATGGTITPAGLYTAGSTVGLFQVIATVQGVGLADTASVTITPPALAQVLIAPASVAFTVGASWQFTVYGRMTNGDSVAVDVTFSASGGSITATGLYTAGPTPGSYQMIATERGGMLADTASVTIAPLPALTAVVLVPAAATLEVGATRLFSAYGRLSTGDSTAISVTYTATGGTITPAGLYTAGSTPGIFRVIAAVQGGTLADTSDVTIAAPQLARVVLVPAAVWIAPKSSQQFLAYGRMSTGDSVAVSVTWTASGGSITSGGLYSAPPQQATFEVIARQLNGTLRDTAVVNVTRSSPPTLTQVVLVPSSATLLVGATRQFAAYGRMSNGDSVALEVTYSATGGTISAGGLYTAGATTGGYRVIARQSGGTLADTSAVTIVPPPTLAQVILVPSSATLQVETTRQFAAYGRMTNGDSVAVNVTYAATGGTITAGGLYAAGSVAGGYQVIARQSGGSLADTSAVTLTPPPTLAQVILVPSSATLGPGAIRQFATYGVMTNGDSVAVSVTYTATGGTITPGGLYSAGLTTGHFAVIVTEQGGTLADTASVTIATLAQVVLVPETTTVATGAVRQFTVYGWTTNGDSVGVSVTYTATGGTITAGGRYTAGQTTGTFEVIATELGGSLGDTASVTIVVPSGVVFVGAGDIADCSSRDDEATAELLDGIQGTVFTTGDNAYPDGSAADYRDCYDPNWGRHKARTRPSPGNHEYNTPGAAGYYDYFGATAGPSGVGYYSYDLGAWHVVSLNSEVDMSAGSAQETWLRADLAANTLPCTVAYWHKPRFSSGTNHGSMAEAQPLWQALYDFGAELVLAGHEHNYERFALQTPGGTADPVRGIREFVVGTGGRSHHDQSSPIANSEVFNGTTFGVLQLTLEAGGYSWQFIPVAGETFTDSGSGSCH